MKRISIEVVSRKQIGKISLKQLRRAGNIPAVIYGESGNRNLQINRADFYKLWKKIAGAAFLIEINEKGKDPVLSLIQEVQREPCTDQFNHIDFREVNRKKPITTNIAVHIVGESTGVKNEGGILEIHAHELEVKGLPKNLPEYIEVNVTDLKVGESIHLSEIKPINETHFIGDTNRLVASCVAPRVVEEEQSSVEKDTADNNKAEEKKKA